MQRDHWILAASRIIGGDTDTNKGALLGEQLDAFVRGTWREWQHLEDPPSDASNKRQALFYLAKAIGQRPRPGDMRLAQIISGKTSQE